MGNGVRLPSSLHDVTFGLKTDLMKENNNVDKVELQVAAFWIKVVKDKRDSSGGSILKFLSCNIMCCKRRFVLLVRTGNFTYRGRLNNFTDMLS